MVKGIASAVVTGVDFIWAHSQRSWGVSDGKCCFDETRIPLQQKPKPTAQIVSTGMVLSLVPVASYCTVELEPRQKTITSM